MPFNYKEIFTLKWNTTQLKYCSLALLTVQASSHAIYLRMVSSRIGKMQIIPTVCVLIQELMKLVVSVALLCYQEHSPKQGITVLYEELIKKWQDTLKVCVPAFIYVLQNNLIFLAARNLEAPVYLIGSQLKIITTAIFTVTLLGKKLTWFQWLAIVILFFGVVLVQLDQREGAKKTPIKTYNVTGYRSDRRSAYRRSASERSQPKTAEKDLLIGSITILTVVMLSGFSGVYWEKLLKNKADISIWLRNAELAIISLPISMFLIVVKDGSAVKTRGFMAGINLSAWINMTITSMGGLLIGIVIKFADNILKAFATSFAIILVCLMSIILFDFTPSVKFALGTFLVISSLFCYNLPKPVQARHSTAR